MAPTSSIESLIAEAATRQVMIDIAIQSIALGLNNSTEPAVDVSLFDAALRQKCASFVTLHRRESLRGCIGSLEATRALIVDVAHNAYAAAFRDPRFPALTTPETRDLHVHISLLSEPTPMHVLDQQDLLAQLRPMKDGLVLYADHRRATFLPSVWESLPSPEDFLRELKRKAGLPPDYWTSRLQFHRYHTASFEFDFPR